MMASPARKLTTVEEWLSLPDEDRAEIIEGEIVRKSLPSIDHSAAQRALAQAIGVFQRKGGGGPLPGGWWIFSEIAVVYAGRPNGFIHDLAGWRRENHPERPRGKRMTLKPDWVCEILSSNRQHDLTTKKWVLHEHRVEWLWMVDVEAEVLSVLKWADKGYLSIMDVSPGKKARLEPFEAVELDVGVLFGGDPD
jgi:Uma2 family endonuclease